MTTTPPTRADLAAARWKTSTYSAANNECVEVAAVGAWVGVRDSKRDHGPALIVPAVAFAAVVDALRTGKL
ncbi:DUF397 domain-containing protein [Streptomyces sp. PKU-EA00015]|uniref:DUF397 domain-containing protein n=1 Tax=Streptomyces sp. PKU-EA00015 TaxID=2748326 RepID=UPI0015A201B6|nr:DUF397 domain-containing protein [Streptomyces sp. PKU-EA00015]NWF30881.1 DUF397 domain-containing protein [Streptomyces sp. PKU-EA00015]